MARIRGFLKRLFHRSAATPEARSENARAVVARSAEPAVARPAVKRASDIPIEAIENAYTPPVTSSKASFRSDGSDHARDQDFITYASEDRWNDEDRLTNKSGDPRIGTHGRSDSSKQEKFNG